MPLEHAAGAGNMELFNALIKAGANGGAGWRGCHGRNTARIGRSRVETRKWYLYLACLPPVPSRT